MDRASSLIYPGSRTLAGWWRQLLPHHPHAIQVGYAFVHRIEAAVQVLSSQPIDSLTHLILQAVGLAQPKSDAESLSQQVLLPLPLLRRILGEMEHAGLLIPSSSGWQTTPRGRIAAEHQQYPVQGCQRRMFAFVERLNPTGVRTDAPQFMPLSECVGIPWPVEETHRFDIDGLHHAIASPADWKQRWAFPADVEAVATDASVPAWQQVIVDRPERVLIVMARCGQGDAANWLGFAAKPDGWSLYEQTPILRVADDAGLTEPPALIVWQDAWRAWCRERNMPLNEVELCSLTYQPPRLEVRAPERMLQRLRAAKSDLLKGEAWLLVGDGFVRTAALLTIA